MTSINLSSLVFHSVSDTEFSVQNQTLTLTVEARVYSSYPELGHVTDSPSGTMFINGGDADDQ